jgi:signal peptidase I
MQTPAPEPPAPARQTPAAMQMLRDIAETLLPAAIIAILINLFLAQATRVYGQSMEPNLHSDERLVVEKLSYRFHGPRRGDIVVLKIPDRSAELLIKRVIALPGERIEIHEGYVYIDGSMLDEPYLTQITSGVMTAQIVPPFHIFVMGDNRGASNDSRSFGMVSLDNIVGRAWVRYWPVNEVGLIH